MNKLILRFVVSVALAITGATSSFAQSGEELALMEFHLSEILKADQQVRAELMQLYQGGDKEALQAKALEMIQTDKENQKYVYPVIQGIMDGKIDGSKLSQNAWKACFLVLQHGGAEDQTKYHDFVVANFEKGYIKNIDYLIFMDRVATKQRKAQPYGSQVAQFGGDLLLVFPVKLKVERDAAFRKIGLDPELFSIVNGSMTYGKPASEAAKSENQYDPIEVAIDEFAIIGRVVAYQERTQSIANVRVLVEGKQVAVSDKNGVFTFKTSKLERPTSLTIVVGDRKIDYPISEEDQKGDFAMLSYVITDKEF